MSATRDARLRLVEERTSTRLEAERQEDTTSQLLPLEWTPVEDSLDHVLVPVD
ncbi:MAG TPA: hypothetical protein VJT84_11050 [Gaiellaceae bacterium]|nr:hypothetical protein [Gaiellaceae bacterium]